MATTRSSGGRARHVELLAVLLPTGCGDQLGRGEGTARQSRFSRFFDSPHRLVAEPDTSSNTAAPELPERPTTRLDPSYWRLPNPLMARQEPPDEDRLILDLSACFDPDEDLPSVRLRYDGDPWRVEFLFRVEEIPYDTRYYIGLKTALEADAPFEREQSVGLFFVTGGGGSSEYRQIDRFWAIRDRTKGDVDRKMSFYEETRARGFSFWERTAYRGVVDWNPENETLTVSVDYPEAAGEALAKGEHPFLPYTASRKVDRTLEMGEYELGVWSHRRPQDPFEKGPMKGRIEIWGVRYAGLEPRLPVRSSPARAERIEEVAGLFANVTEGPDFLRESDWYTYCIQRNLVAVHGSRAAPEDLGAVEALRDAGFFERAAARVYRTPEELGEERRVPDPQPAVLAEDIRGMSRLAGNVTELRRSSPDDRLLPIIFSTTDYLLRKVLRDVHGMISGSVWTAVVEIANSRQPDESLPPDQASTPLGLCQQARRLQDDPEAGVPLLRRALDQDPFHLPSLQLAAERYAQKLPFAPIRLSFLYALAGYDEEARRLSADLSGERADERDRAVLECARALLGP